MSHYFYHRNNSCGNYNNRSNYCGCCHDEPMIVEEKKESSATAKTALGLAIGGLGLAALNGGFNNGECGNGGGILGGLFGNRNTGHCEQLARGRQAQTELAVVHQYMMPTWFELSELKKKVAVNEALEHKNQEINYLLFKRSEENTAAGFEINKLRTEAAFALADQRSQCCCDKNDMKIDYVSNLSKLRTDGLFALARQEQECCCDKTNAKIDYVSTLQQQRSDAEFALNRQRTDAAFALADQRQQCCCDRLDERITCEADKINAKVDCVVGGLSAKTDAAFVVSNLETDAKLCEATRNLVRGEVYLSPASLADPYRAGTNVLLSRHYNGCGSNYYNNECGGCGGSGWYNW